MYKGGSWEVVNGGIGEVYGEPFIADFVFIGLKGEFI
jgi:hypothetical protein